MKRKIDSVNDLPTSDTPRSIKRRAHEQDKAVKHAPKDVIQIFRPDLFEPWVLQSHQEKYAASTPYPHAVVASLIDSQFLTAVRSEITSNIHFTPKETDIYRIHQSGDLANLSNLDTESLKRLPNLVRLRDALYSTEFREWISSVTGAGKVSGKKTDMAVNVYTPGSYLLCHDDVIGSRRISYILYLTDPGTSWKKEWGGGLRLYPTEIKKNKAGEEVKVPLAEHNLNIPPSFSQLSFFAVRPGESYHDVEEVYHRSEGEPDDDGGRVRMAISGWFHIPQEGEDGFEEGLEQSQAQKSSLAQLKGASNEFDEPQIQFRHYDEPRKVMSSNASKEEVDPDEAQDEDEEILTEQDLTFLLHYISPSFLTPDMIEQFAQSFEETSVLQLDRFFGDKFANELRSYISNAESHNSFSDSESRSSNNHDPQSWPIARPPHKQRYAYLQTSESLHEDKSSPISRILVDLLHSHAFKKWLALVAGFKPHSLVRQTAIARRFRRGHDYALANPFKGEQPQLEFTISMTPSTGWEKDEEEHHTKQKQEKREEKDKQSNGTYTNGHINGNDKVKVETSDQPDFGGEEVYMAGDEEDEDDETTTKQDDSDLPQVGRKVDPAVYKTGDDNDDGGILFSNAPSWNQFSVVLRDKGTLRFVKYVSQAAKGDRWDIKGEVELGEDAFDGEDEGVEGGEEADEGIDDLEESEEEDEEQDLEDGV